MLLRNWLKLDPHPFSVRAEMGDGEERIVRVNQSRSRWRDAEECLKGAVSCEALNRDGEILRVWKDEDHALASFASQATSTAVPRAAVESRSDLAPLGDPLAALRAIAALIAEAADAGAARHADAYRLAYEQQTLLVQQTVQVLQTVTGRLSTLEGAWQRLLLSQAQVQQDVLAAQAEAAAGAQDPGATQMVMNLLGGLVAGQQQAPAPPPQRPPPNGAAQ